MTGLRTRTLKRSLKEYFLFAMSVSLLLFAASPPERINYQGVLRDSSDKPISGNVSMRFRFYDDPLGGTLLWEEVYDPSSFPPEISVSDGLFTVALGDPAHRNTGSILNFAEIFKNYSSVHLAVAVVPDPEMTPRIKVISSAYALNAEHLSGKSAGEFLDTSSFPQTKYAPLTLDASSVLYSYGVEGRGLNGGGYFLDSNQSGYAYVGYGDEGIRAYRNNRGGSPHHGHSISPDASRSTSRRSIALPSPVFLDPC
ncbi:MAG: hypothetical protein AB1756_04110 [Acidobacteriota bacterium]